jgi:hypothetical protein
MEKGEYRAGGMGPKMNGLIIGFDLCDSYTQIAVYDENGADAVGMEFSQGMEEIPTTICKCRRKDEWKIGEAACEMALLGAGIVVDKLLRLVKKGGHATLENRTYQAQELLEIYIREALAHVREQYDKPIVKIIFTVDELDRVLLDDMMKSTVNLGFQKEQIQIISHTESFLYYLLRQNTDNFANLATVFDLSKEGLWYYECDVLRGMNPQIARAAGTRLEEGFSLDILESEAGRKLADNIFQACVDRQFNRKVVSSVYLTGRGMKEIQEWGSKSLTRICNRRKVYLESELFAKGAVWMGVSLEDAELVRYPYTMIGEGRILADVEMTMQVAGISKSLLLLQAGDRWYTARGRVEFILDDCDNVELQITQAGAKKSQVCRIPLGELPNRPNKTTRVRLEAEFTSETQLRVIITDLGFGEMFPADGCVLVREISLQ